MSGSMRVYFPNPQPAAFIHDDFATFETRVTQFQSSRAIDFSSSKSFLWALQKAAQFRVNLQFFEEERPKALAAAQKAFQELTVKPQTVEDSLAILSVQDRFSIHQAAKKRMQWIESAIVRIKQALNAFEDICKSRGIEGHRSEANMD